MKATARVITGSIRGRAQGISSSAAVAYALPTGVGGQARAVDQSDITKFLYVTPTEPQQLVWLVPQYGIDYTVESNTNWTIK